MTQMDWPTEENTCLHINLASRQQNKLLIVSFREAILF